ncbi:MAG: preprotein translocase subunit SecY [Clostridia bacterium]|nr:preprotein translocase subunit SecY [Clostridia bacterium]
MFRTLINAWKVTDLRKKILFTLIIAVLYRLGCQIPVPFVSSDVLRTLIDTYSGSMFGYLNILSGQAFSQATLFALGVSPYITAQIVMQLLAIAIPALEKLSKDGEEGRKKIDKITRIVTIVLSLVTAYGYYSYLRANGALIDTGVFAGVIIVAAYCGGAALVMWLADKVDDYGIGNGISIILFVNILSSGWSMAQKIYAQFVQGGWNILFAVLSIIMMVAIITFVVFITNSERRIPIQYAKRVVGRKMYGGQASNLPLKLNMSGVMPIIFASSIVSIPATLAIFWPPKEGGFWDGFVNLFQASSPLYLVIYIVLIFLFSYFYISISFDTVEVSNNLQRDGGFIPGIRPGRPTSDYIKRVLNRITLIGAIFLAIVAGIPLLVNMVASNQFGMLAFGGSSLLIVVSVALETARELESQLAMRHYKGFLE